MDYFHRNAVLISILFVFVVHSLSPVGDFCRFQGTGGVGQCKLFSECPKAIEALQERRIFSQTCGFKGALPVVCCARTRSARNVVVNRVGDISKQKCIEYGEYSNSQPILFPGDDVPKILNVCANLENKISQPNLARPKEFPHMAAVGFDDPDGGIVWRSTGSLISERFVLTAAHYLADRDYGDAKFIRIGDIDLESTTDDAMPQNFKIIETFKHPDYKPPSAYNDIALLKMDKEAILSSYARPACLDIDDSFTHGKAINTAWGSINGSSYINPHLLKDSLEFVSHAECRESYRSSDVGIRLKNGIMDETQLCVGPHTRKNTCVLDSGGPLQVYDGGVFCTYKIVGIASFGKPCSVENVDPIVFTRVSAYIEWIEGIVWP